MQRSTPAFWVLFLASCAQGGDGEGAAAHTPTAGDTLAAALTAPVAESAAPAAAAPPLQRPPTVPAFEPAGPPQPAAAMPVMGTVTLVGVPSEATVLVNGSERHGTDMTLPPGWYSVVVQSAGFLPFEQTVQIAAGQGDSLWVTLEALDDEVAQVQGARAEREEQSHPSILEIRVAGDDARIILNGVLVRRGISHRAEVEPGRHRIRLERDGQTVADTTVIVAAGDTVVVRIEPREGELDGT